jgi:hypothetical protein
MDSTHPERGNTFYVLRETQYIIALVIYNLLDNVRAVDLKYKIWRSDAKADHGSRYIRYAFLQKFVQRGARSTSLLERALPLQMYVAIPVLEAPFTLASGNPPALYFNTKDPERSNQNEICFGPWLESVITQP